MRRSEAQGDALVRGGRERGGGGGRGVFGARGDGRIFDGHMRQASTIVAFEDLPRDIHPPTFKNREEYTVNVEVYVKWRSEVRSQRSEVRSQRSEVRSQRSEVRGQEDEKGSPATYLKSTGGPF